VTALSPQVQTREIDAIMRSLYARFSRKIHSFCSQQLGSHEEAEDATQLTFLNAFRGLERGASLEYESAWLFKIAHNVCLNSHRSSLRRRRIEMPSDPEALENHAHPGAYEPNELFGLSEALQALPERQRQAILLREWRGLSYKEIAAELDLSEAAVETLLFRARRSLSLALTEERGAGQRNRLGLIGSLLATPQHLLFGSGAKVAATVATVVATSAAVATPAARHDLAGGLDWAARQIAAEIRPGPNQILPRHESRASTDVGRVPPAVPESATAPAFDSLLDNMIIGARRSWSPMPSRTSRFGAAGTPASASGDAAGSADVPSPAPVPEPDSSGAAAPGTLAASDSSVTASSSPASASTVQNVGTSASQQAANATGGGADSKPSAPPESVADSDAPADGASTARGNSDSGNPSDLPDGAKAAQGAGEDASHEAGPGQGGGSQHSEPAETAADETDQPVTVDPETVDRQPPGKVDSVGNGGDHGADDSAPGTKGVAGSTGRPTQ
jgi:RNA polymerase sigma factor (sigma-70 family)